MLELSVDEDSLLWGFRVIEPGCLQCEVLALLHDAYPSMARIINLTKCCVWWPRLDVVIDDEVVVRCVPGSAERHS
jgi:hypothetical protein